MGHCLHPPHCHYPPHWRRTQILIRIDLTALDHAHPVTHTLSELVQWICQGLQAWLAGHIGHVCASLTVCVVLTAVAGCLEHLVFELPSGLSPLREWVNGIGPLVAVAAAVSQLLASAVSCIGIQVTRHVCPAPVASAPRSYWLPPTVRFDLPAQCI